MSGSRCDSSWRRSGQLVHIVQKRFEDMPEAAAETTFEASDAEGTTRLVLERKIDLDGDGTPELVFNVPDEVARDARYLSFYAACGDGTFYPLLAEYAADYEIGEPTRGGWRSIRLYNNISPEKPSSTVVSEQTYQFARSRYGLVESRRVKRRIL